MPGPLEGYRVVDPTSMISGPLATTILADQRADVIKVENPDGRDHIRASNSQPAGSSASFLNNNRNKRSLALDLKQPEARQAPLRAARFSATPAAIRQSGPALGRHNHEIPAALGHTAERIAELSSMVANETKERAA
jgi:crotonobetainyl-CoA:carnitine CoA-transferase CaiB-like acyl-CoA transferase